MRRRAFLTGTTAVLSLFAGCTGDSRAGSENSPTNSQTSSKPTEPPTQQTPTRTTDTTAKQPKPTTARSTGTTVSQPITDPPSNTTSSVSEREAACNGGIYLDFYALRSDAADGMWDPDVVSIAYGLGPGAHVRLVVFEDDTVLGIGEDFAPKNSSLDMDGLPIQLDEKLSGEHTLRAVMYPQTSMTEQFDAEEATPCKFEGKPVQAGPTTIDFDRFSEGTPSPS